MKQNYSQPCTVPDPVHVHEQESNPTEKDLLGVPLNMRHQTSSSSDENEQFGVNANKLHNLSGSSFRKLHFFSNMKLASPSNEYVQGKEFSSPIQITDFSSRKEHEHSHQDSSPLMMIELSHSNLRHQTIKRIAEEGHEESDEGDSSLSLEHDQMDREANLGEMIDENHCESSYSPLRNGGFLEEQEQQEDALFDLMGNKVCEFSMGIDDADYEKVLQPIVEDKENDRSFASHKKHETMSSSNHNMMTPLKIRHKDVRSPLEDITPSMTQKKKLGTNFKTKTNKKNRTNNKGIELEKWGLLTPRTMAESRMNKTNNAKFDNSRFKIQRF